MQIHYEINDILELCARETARLELFGSDCLSQLEAVPQMDEDGIGILAVLVRVRKEEP